MSSKVRDTSDKRICGACERREACGVCQSSSKRTTFTPYHQSFASLIDFERQSKHVVKASWSVVVSRYLPNIREMIMHVFSFSRYCGVEFDKTDGLLLFNRAVAAESGPRWSYSIYPRLIRTVGSSYCYATSICREGLTVADS